MATWMNTYAVQRIRNCSLLHHVIRIGLLNNSNMHWTLPPLFQMKRMNGFASEIATYIYGNIDVHRRWCCAYISKLPRKSAVSLSTQGQGYSNVLDKIHCQVHDEGHSTIEKKFNWFWNVEHLKHWLYFSFFNLY